MFCVKVRLDGCVVIEVGGCPGQLWIRCKQASLVESPVSGGGGIIFSMESGVVEG